MSGGNRTDAKLELSGTGSLVPCRSNVGQDTFAYFYVDGELLYQAGISNYSGFNLGVAYGGSESDWNRAFWIGYAYNADRFFPGYMAEVRVWNRTFDQGRRSMPRTTSLRSGGSGGFGYWKLQRRCRYIVKDSRRRRATTWWAKINVRSSNGQQIGDEGMNWVEMSLP